MLLVVLCGHQCMSAIKWSVLYISGEDCVWYVCDVLYTVLCVCVCCFVVCGCAVLRRYVDVCYCDILSVVNVYLGHLKFYVVCVYGRWYVCCGDCYVVSNECDEPTFCLVQLIVAYCCDVMYILI